MGAALALALLLSLAAPSERQILVTVLDDVSSVPCASVPVAALAIGTEEPLARAVTDERGRARLRLHDLRHEMATIEVLSQPGRRWAARRLCVRFLAEQSSLDLRVRLGRGAVVVGRVLDDLGEPVEGLAVARAPSAGEVAFELAWERGSVELARTDAAGRFRVERVAGRRSSFSMSPHVPVAELPPELELSFGQGGPHSGRFLLTALEGELVDLGDVVIPRERVFAGRVVDAAGSPVAGALVSANLERLAAEMDWHGAGAELRRAPGSPGFALLENEALSGPDGEFELRARGAPREALVRTPRGACARGALEDPGPGERAEGLVLAVPRDDVLAVALVGPDGFLLRAPSPWGQLGQPDLEGTRSPSFAQTAFELEDTFGARCRLFAAADADGLFRLTLPSPRSSLVRLHAQLLGWAGAEAVRSDLAGDGPVVLPLAPLPEVLLEVVCAEAPETSRWRAHLELAACRLPPGEREPAGNRGCGDGCTLAVTLVGSAPVACALPVQAPGSYFVHVRQRWGPSEEVLTYGPFEPGAERHAIGIPDRLGRERGEPSPEVLPGCEVELFVVDAETGEPVCGAYCSTNAALQDRTDHGRTDVRGRAAVRADPDERCVWVWAEGYEDATHLVPALSDAGLVHGGTVHLAPDGLPRFRVELQDERGRPLPATFLLVRNPGESWRHVGSYRDFDRPLTESEGWLVDLSRGQLRAAVLPAVVSDVAREPRRSASFAGARAARRGRADAVVLEVRGAPVRDVELLLRGLPPSDAFRDLGVSICPVDRESGEALHLRPLVLAPREALLPTRDGTRTFRAALSTGRFAVTVARSTVPFPPFEIEVVEREGTQVFELAAEDD